MVDTLTHQRTLSSDSSQNGRALRRLASDHAALRNQPLPPNYLFPPNGGSNDDLMSLDILLAGPAHTPFESGVFKLHLQMPTNYPEEPPVAHFRTPIFHPNVNPVIGGVCVETLKRDWDPRLTLRDILLTISCLLIHPNPDSALNADAAGLFRNDYDAYERRARLMISIQAKVPNELEAAVKEAQTRGQDNYGEGEGPHIGEKRQSIEAPSAPARRRKVTTRQRGTASYLRSSDGSPSSGPAIRRQQTGVPPPNPFSLAAGDDDVFGIGNMPTGGQGGASRTDWDDSSMMDANQENDETLSPNKNPVATPPALTPRRLNGHATPLGELSLEEDGAESSLEDSLEAEYPPSPRKPRSKSPVKRKKRVLFAEREDIDDSETSADSGPRASNATPSNATEASLLEHVVGFAAIQQASSSPRKNNPRAPNITPPNAADTPLLDHVADFAASEQASSSPRKKNPRAPNFTPNNATETHLLGEVSAFDAIEQETSFPRQRNAFPQTSSSDFHPESAGLLSRLPFGTPKSVMEALSPSSSAKKRAEEERIKNLNEQLWEACGRDVKRWNKGDFGPLGQKLLGFPPPTRF